MAISKGLLAVLLAAGAYLAGVAVSFCGTQTAIIASGAGDSSSTAATTTTTPAGCEPPAGFRLPVSLEVMKGIDAAVLVAIVAAWVPANNAIDSMPFPFQRSVRYLAKGAFGFGVLAPDHALPTCPVAAPAAAGGGGGSTPASAGPGGCSGPCSPFSRTVRRRVNIGGVIAFAVASIPVYFNLATWTPHQD